MSIDYHVHLEEGPYSFKWLNRTNKALGHFKQHSLDKHTYGWLNESMERVMERIRRGAYHESWVDLYLQEAKRKGLKEVGIVDHLYRFHETRPYFEKHLDLSDTDIGKMQQNWLNQVMTEKFELFVAAIEKAKLRWAKQGVILRLGIEADYFPGCEKELQKLLEQYEWDFVIGSVHFLDGWGFDNPDSKDQYENVDLYLAYERFFRVVEKAIRSKLFDFIAHLDNFKVFGYRPDEQLLVPHYHRIAKALAETNTATEINAGLYYRYPIKEMCPSPNFLDILLQHRVHFTISSDSHFPDDVGNFVERNKQALLQSGVQRVATFDKRKRIMKAIGELFPS